MSHSIETAEIGSTGLRVTRLGLGGAPMSAFMYDVDESEAVALISRAFELGVRYFDTAPYYGFGRSERRYGKALSEAPTGRLRDIHQGRARRFSLPTPTPRTTGSFPTSWTPSSTSAETPS